MIHAGVGPTHMNAILTSMNIPPIADSTLSRRSHEAGPAIETVARRSCEEAMEAERQAELTKQNAHDDGQNVDLSVSYDMGWQKPRGFNSLTGT